jgi:hypothetical protein
MTLEIAVLCLVSPFVLLICYAAWFDKRELLKPAKREGV